MEVQFVQAVFSDNPVNIEMQPERHSNMFEQSDRPGCYADVMGQPVLSRREEEQVRAFQL
jgi:hypothetical protein